MTSKLVPKLRTKTGANGKLQNKINNDAELLKRVISGDETWVYGYDVEVKSQSSNVVDFNSTVHHEFLPQNQTVNEEY